MSETVLVGDIGGTSARFGLVSTAASGAHVHNARKLDGDEYTHFEDAMAAYLDMCGERPDEVLLAVAGPILPGYVELTNRNWRISVAELMSRFGFSSVKLVNDFVAMARAVPALPDDDFETLRSGYAERDAPILVAGPGTGLGMATLLPDGEIWRVLGGEGGHAAFAPRSAEDVAIANILNAEHGFVSYELVASGMGLEPVHRAMCQLHGVAYEQIAPTDMLTLADNGDTICQRVCALRARAVMGFAGDMTLANGARGGVVLAGGVTSRLLPWLRAAEAQARFLDRGPRSAYMSPIPVRAIRGEFVGLKGAAALFREGGETGTLAEKRP